MVFLAIHVLTAVLDTYVTVGWAAAVIPFASPYRPLWTGLGTVGVDLILAVGVSSALRQRISPRTWRGIHWLAYGSWPVAMAHSLGMGTDAAARWFDALAVSVHAGRGRCAGPGASPTTAGTGNGPASSGRAPGPCPSGPDDRPSTRPHRDRGVELRPGPPGPPSTTAPHPVPRPYRRPTTTATRLLERDRP